MINKSETVQQELEISKKNKILELLRKKEEILKEFKIDRFVPNAGGQALFFENGDKKRRFVLSGNRWGKTTGGNIEDISFAIGERRWYPKNDPRRYLGIPKHGVKGLVVVQDWNKVEELFTGEGTGLSPKGKLMEWCPKLFIQQKWRDNLGRTTKVAFRNVIDGRTRDSIIYFATVQAFARNEMSLESSDWDFIHVDEPIPKPMWTAVSRGLVDRAGAAWFLLTPLSELWIYEMAINGCATNAPDFWMYTGSSSENKHVAGLELFHDSLSEEELACRRDGKPLSMGRLVIHGYREDKHLIKGVPLGWTNLTTPPKEALMAVAIDTHPQTPHAVLVAAITPTDVIFMDEYFEKGSIDLICKWLKSKPYFNQIGYFLLEPAAWIVDQTTGRCYADTFLEYGINVQKASKERTRAIEVINEAFYATSGRAVRVHESLKHTRRELMTWYFKKDNKPVDENDHFTENLGRLFMHDNLAYHHPPEEARVASQLIINKSIRHNSLLNEVNNDSSLVASINCREL